MAHYNHHDYSEDEWYDPRYRPTGYHASPCRPSPRPVHVHRRSGLLDPNAHYTDSGGLHRSRSQGSRPRPEINIYNEVFADAATHANNPVVYPAAPGAYPIGAYPPSPQYRGRRLGDELLADELAELRLEKLARSRSRGRSDAGPRSDSPKYRAWEAAQREKEFKDAERKREMEREYELRKLQGERDRKRREEDEESEHKRFIAEYELRKLEAAKKAKVEEEALRLRIEREKAEREAERIELVEKIEKEKREAAAKQKAAEEALLAKIEKDRKAAREKEEREERELLQKLKAKKEAEEKQKREEEERIEAEMKKRLAQFGFQNNQIEAMLDPKKADQIKPGATPSKSLQVHQPVYSKVHREYLDVDTLRYYEIPYEYDRTNPDYIIILREMDKYQTEVLFEHTRRLRKGRLLIEDKKEPKKYAWVRHRDRSRSTGRKEVRKIEVLEVRR